MNTTQQPYEKLIERFEKIIDLENAAAILGKDMEVFMPENSGDDRSRQLVALAEACHGLITDPRVAQWLDEAERGSAGLSPIDKRNLTLMRREWVLKTALPDELAAEKARIESEGMQLHTEVGRNGNWSEMRDWYAHSFETMRAIGQLQKDKLGVDSAYDALLCEYSPDIADAAITREFATLEKILPGMIHEAVKRQEESPQPIPLQGSFPQEQQAELCRRLAVAMGFDFDGGRLDIIDAHPSVSDSASDVRYTVNCSDETNFLRSVYMAVHETGHAIYEQGTPIKYRYQRVGASMGMAVHESQSGVMERNAAHTPEFFQYLEKQAREIFNRPDDPALSAENLRLLANQVQPSLIRTAADELTYPVHIILRHKLERSLIEGAMSIDDLPQAWNEGMQQLLGITPPDNAKGCMQDIHWAIGAIGYFPSYALGNMIAAQFYAAAVKTHPEIPAELAKGNFAPLGEWLKKNVHSKGSMLTTDELMTAATGEKLNAKHYLDHLSQRYLGRPLGQAPAAAPTSHQKQAKRPSAD